VSDIFESPGDRDEVAVLDELEELTLPPSSLHPETTTAAARRASSLAAAPLRFLMNTTTPHRERRFLPSSKGTRWRHAVYAEGDEWAARARAGA
jgi:hypothetical protein